MNKYIESVNEDKRPKEGFVCSTCPFAGWSSGSVEYVNYDFNKNSNPGVEEDFLDCYCHKTHTYTFDSAVRTSTAISKETKNVVFYKHKTKCQDKDLAINEILGGK